VVTNDLGVARVDFGRTSRAGGPLGTDSASAAGHLDQVLSELGEYFVGERENFTVALDRSGRLGFSGEVLAALESVPYGTTLSYGDLAAFAGRPKAFRAVGTTMGRNPIAVIVPCHRVVRSGGALGEYGGGVAAKQWLLDLEGLKPSST
jgi:methylated-DNA-[protein]-cysteine S-methyltransferase